MKVIKIPYDLSEPCMVCEVSEPDSGACLDDIKKVIDIDYAEIVLTYVRSRFGDPFREYVLIVDEVGNLKDNWDTRVNKRASVLYRGFLSGDPIVGDVVLCPREWSPNFGERDLVGFSDAEIVSFMTSFDTWEYFFKKRR